MDDLYIPCLSDASAPGSQDSHRQLPEILYKSLIHTNPASYIAGEYSAWYYVTISLAGK
jgi:hypothetical protein